MIDLSWFLTIIYQVFKDTKDCLLNSIPLYVAIDTIPSWDSNQQVLLRILSNRTQSMTSSLVTSSSVILSLLINHGLRNIPKSETFDIFRVSLALTNCVLGKGYTIHLQTNQKTTDYTQKNLPNL